jgi:hypothetical protein
MISGLVSPQSIGFKGKEDINKLVKTTEILFILSEMTGKITQIFAFIVLIVALGLNYEFIYQLVFFGIPWSLILALSVITRQILFSGK